jgi:hypothetical protein
MYDSFKPTSDVLVQFNFLSSNFTVLVEASRARARETVTTTLYKSATRIGCFTLVLSNLVLANLDIP